MSGSVRGAHEGAAHTVAESIDASGHRVQVRELGGTVRELAYDRLIVATGAAPAKPPIRGLDARSRWPTRYDIGLGTQAVKVFDLVVGRTGFRDDEARRYGFDPLTTGTTAWDHKAYYRAPPRSASA